jgi:DNA (cytosine-5)-methyltransferase 1
MNCGYPGCNQGGIAIVQPTMVLNDQGGQQMSISYDVTSTLRAEDHQHPPLVIHEPQTVFSAGFKPRQSAAARTLGYEEEMAPTINTDENYAVVHSAGFSYGQSAQARSLGYQEEVSPTLRGGEGGNQKPCVLDQREAIPIENHPNDSRAKLCEDGIVQTLSGRMGTGGNNTPLVLAFDTTQVTSPMNYSNPKPGDPCHPLASTAHPPAIAFAQNQREEVRDLEDVATAVQAEAGTHQQTFVTQCIGNGQADIASHISEEVAQTLNCMHDQLAVHTYGLDRASYNQGQNAQFDFSVEEESAPTQVSRGPGAVSTNVVRRLTPMECERLQSYPDFWTDIGEWTDSQGKKHRDADSPRYKALGNSIALPFWDWLLGRISMQYDRPATLGSLFDGIGGFPLCWEHHNGKGTALWASEIEEFPIAVTKLHFPEDDDGEDRPD